MEEIIKENIKGCKRIIRLVQVRMNEQEVAYLFYNNKKGKVECNIILKKGITYTFKNHLFYICQFRKNSKIKSALKKWI